MNDIDSPRKENGYSQAQIREIVERTRELRNSQPRIQVDLAHLAGQLTNQRASIFANQAMGRRLPVIERAALNMLDIYPPNRKEFLTKIECTDIAIQLHAFAINVYAIFDNAAWICMLEAGKALPPLKVGLFKKECQMYIPDAIKEYMAGPTVTKWFNDYGKVYRDSTAHRIPPYLPDRSYTPGEGQRWKELNNEAMELLFSWRPSESHEEVTERLGRYEQLETEKSRLGRNSLMVALTLTGEDAKNPIYLHPQLLCDWGLVQEFVQLFVLGMRQHYGWKAPEIPPMNVI